MAKQETAIEKVIEGVKEIAKEVVENVEDAAGKMAEDVVEGVEKVAEKVESVAEKAAPKGVPSKEGKEKKEKLEKSSKDTQKGHENLQAGDSAKSSAEKKTAPEEVPKEGDNAPKGVPQEGKEQKIFALYDISVVEISDPGLKNVINLDYKLMVKSHGRIRERYGKANVNIFERLVNTLCVPGHRGKKHKIISKWTTGKYNKNAKVVLEAFRIIEEKTKKNPIQVLVSAIERGAPRDEVTMIQYGGARYPQAVDCAPLRRVSLALRNIVHGAYDKSFRSKKSIAQTLADELMVTAENGASVAVNKRIELEKQADAAR